MIELKGLRVAINAHPLGGVGDHSEFMIRGCLWLTLSKKIFLKFLSIIYKYIPILVYTNSNNLSINQSNLEFKS